MHRLSIMESNDIVSELDADRSALADRVRTPWWLAAGFGLIAACFVVRPASGGQLNAVFIACLVFALSLLACYRAATGVKLARLGAAPWLLALAGLAVVLALYSVALGLASFDLHGWIAAPTALAFASGAALTYAFTGAARERMRRVR